MSDSTPTTSQVRNNFAFAVALATYATKFDDEELLNMLEDIHWPEPGLRDSIKDDFDNWLIKLVRPKRDKYEEAEYVLTSWYSDTRWFPFVENSNGDITGPGHQNPRAFVISVAEYDDWATEEEPEIHSTVDVKHKYAVIHEDMEMIDVVEKDHPLAVPITTLWGVR